MNYHTDFNVLPLEAELEWFGWRATLMSLKHAGWDMEVIQRPDTYSSAILMKHPELGKQAMSHEVTAHQWEMMHLPQHRGQYFGDGCTIRMHMAESISIHGVSQPSRIEGFGSAIPLEFGRYIDNKMVKLDDLFSHNHKPDEIIIEKRPEIIDLLGQIKDLQEPRAKELLAKERKRGKVESFETTTNIIALRA